MTKSNGLGYRHNGISLCILESDSYIMPRYLTRGKVMGYGLLCRIISDHYFNLLAVTYRNCVTS